VKEWRKLRIEELRNVLYTSDISVMLRGFQHVTFKGEIREGNKI
jgi:hypothetical protein